MSGLGGRAGRLALILLLASPPLPAAAAADPAALQVRASAAFAPCLAPALEAFTRVSRIPAALTVAEPDPPEGADVVVGDDSEMTRLLEGGGALLASAFDLGEVPWVTVGSGPSALGAGVGEPVAVLGGKAGREARAALGASSSRPARVDVTDDMAVLRAATHAWVPRTLAGAGPARPAQVRPLVATVALVSASPRLPAGRRLLAFLASPEGRRELEGCFDRVGATSPDGRERPDPAARGASASTGGQAGAAAPFADRVVDWWLPQCSLTRNRYNDPGQVVGPPDARNLGGVENFQGFMSLGQGGFVTVDMGTTVVDGPGPEIRVYQTTTGEPVTLYGSLAPEGPFVLLGLQVPCGVRTPGIFSNHCNFDLAAGGLAAARYFRVEDGEIYPCLAGGTVTEGADIDAVEVLPR